MDAPLHMLASTGVPPIDIVVLGGAFLVGGVAMCLGASRRLYGGKRAPSDDARPDAAGWEAQESIASLEDLGYFETCRRSDNRGMSVEFGGPDRS